jgi:glycosyltransferase involved in cell wall biosynthesis/SAM-dependent methyltransferase
LEISGEMMAPKVSICMPTYNFARYLPEAIESVLKQSYGDYEFLIIDDCSRDGSAEVIMNYARQDKRIIASVNAFNIGMVNNWNLCLQRARGEYIKFLFGDDVLSSPDALKRMVSVLDGHRGIALVASARNVIDEHSNIMKIWTEYRGKIGYRGSKIIRDCLIEQKNKIGEPSVVLFRRKQAGRGFDARYRQAVDLEMWFHLLEQGNFAYLDEPLCSFRWHSRQQTNINVRGESLVEEAFLLLQSYADKPYVKMPRLIREYMQYVPVYSIWKLYKNDRISRAGAIAKIRERYSLSKFISYYPLYKIYKFIARIVNTVSVAASNVFSLRRQWRGPSERAYAPGDTEQVKKAYYEYTRREIVDLLPENTSRVLEVGCGSGNTLAWLKNLKRCAWVGGVEMMPDAAALARKKLDDVFLVNIEKSDIPVPEGSLDLILCLDVLEHMVDPWAVVCRLQKMLKPGGALIASIPNVRNQAVLFPLLFQGKWDYADAGFLDRSHLRFFVRESAIELVASSGLKVDMVLSTGLGRSRRTRVVNSMLPSLVKSIFEKQYLIRGIRVD